MSVFKKTHLSLRSLTKHHWSVNLKCFTEFLLLLCFSSYVYKCVCQQHSELLYSDLTLKIISHLQQVSTHLQVSKSKHSEWLCTAHTEALKVTHTCVIIFQASPPENFIENFNVALTQYTASLQCIVPVFMYLVGISLLNIDGTNLGYGVNFLAHSLHGVTLLGCHLYSRWCMLLRLFFSPPFWMFSEQVLHRVKAEQRPERGSDEAVCWSRCRETCEHTDA